RGESGGGRGRGREVGGAPPRAACPRPPPNASGNTAGAGRRGGGGGGLGAGAPPTGGGGRGGRPPHPLVVVGAVMLALYEKRDPEQALQVLAAHFESADPWTRAGARLMHAFSSIALGRLDDVARESAE